MDHKLNEYKEKRNIEKSLEPEGVIGESGEILRFVVQHHLASRDHYDFRLEWRGVLLSWAVPKGPSYNTKDKRLAINVEDHPLDYRNFEGTIPKGQYGGGTVMLWDEGFWEPYTNVDEGLDKGELKFILKGTRLKGKWALIRLKGKEGNNVKLLTRNGNDYIKKFPNIAFSLLGLSKGRPMVLDGEVA